MNAMYDIFVSVFVHLKVFVSGAPWGAVHTGPSPLYTVDPPLQVGNYTTAVDSSTLYTVQYSVQCSAVQCTSVFEVNEKWICYSLSALP